ncbi:MAG: hypothetical protein WBB25_14095, partial [Sulfitobacter sp.]
NNGNITLQTATVTDNRTVLPASCIVGPIPPGSTDDTCRFTYVVTQADIDSINTVGGEITGGFTNTASVTAEPVNPALDDIIESGEVFVGGPLREPSCMYRLLFASDQLHVFWKSLICIRPLDRLVVLPWPCWEYARAAVSLVT